MGVTVGEVTTVMKAKDEMSDAFENAARKSQELDTRLQDVEKSTRGLNDILGGMRDALVEVFSAREIYEFLNTILESAHSLQILSQQTDISVTELQVLKLATEEYGVNAEQLGRALFQLSRRIAGGDESATSALHMLGLNLQELKGLDPEALFLRVTAALGEMQGPLRDLAASELFGGRLGKSVLAMAGNIEESMDKIRGSVNIASEQSVKELAEMENAINRLKTSMFNFATEGIGQFAQAVNVLIDTASNSGHKWEILKAQLLDFAGASLPLGISTSHLAELIDQLSQRQAEETQSAEAGAAAHRGKTEALTAEAQAQRFMAQLMIDAAKPLEEWQKRDLIQLKEIGELNSKNAVAIGVNVDQYNKFKEALAKTEEAEKKFKAAMDELNSAGAGVKGTIDTVSGSFVEAIKYYLEAGVSQHALAEAYGLTESQIKAVATEMKEEAAATKKAEQEEARALEEATKLWDEYFQLRVDHGSTATDQQIAQIDRWAADLTAKMQRIGADTAEFYDALGSVVDEKMRGVGIDFEAINKDMSTGTQKGLQQIADKAMATYQEATKHAGQFSQETIDKYFAAAQAAQKSADMFGMSYAENANKATAGIDRTTNAIKGMNQALSGGAGGKSAFQQENEGVQIPVFGASGYLGKRQAGFSAGHAFETPGHGASGFLGGEFRASGGPVSPGRSYMVGEGGPELFTPSSAGNISPNGAGGVNVYISGVIASDRDALMSYIKSGLEEGLRQTHRF